MHFSLSKWYLDVVTSDGSVAIAYWAEVRWGPLRQPFSGLLLRSTTHGSRPWRFTGRHLPQPRVADDGVLWSADPLDLAVEYRPLEPAFEQRLLDTHDGVIDWHCTAPRAAARMRVGDIVLEGTGYVEHLSMSVLPWRVPADEIRWGRFLADDTSVVWIDWHGEHPQSFVFHDGKLASAASITDGKVRFGERVHLDLNVARVVSDDTLGGLLAPMAKLRPLVEPVAHAHQSRWLSHGALHGIRTEPIAGWALHEVARRT